MTDKRKKRKDFFKKYRLVIVDQQSLAEKFSTWISRFKLWVLGLISFTMIAAFLVALIFYTPLKQLVPGYPSYKMRDLMLYNEMLLDSMENELQKRDQYLMKIQQVISGGIVEEDLYNIPIENNGHVQLSETSNDSIFEGLIGPDKYKFNAFAGNEDMREITQLNFFPPARGLVINRFEATPGHFGVDVVGEENTYISSILDGTVIFAEWSVSTGYVVQIQHAYNLISIYKHNADVLVKPGQKVEVGEVIAIMGDEGEYSTGPHLHFEIWQSGVPLNPENLIAFSR